MLQLTPREKRAASLAGVLLTVLTLYGFCIKPTLKRTARLYELVPEKQAELWQIKRDQATYQRLLAHLNGAGEKPVKGAQHTGVLPRLDRLLTKEGLQPYVTGITPQTPDQQEGYTRSTVDLTLEAVSLSDLLRFVEKAQESPTPLQLSSLHITPQADHQGRVNTKLRFQVVTQS